MKRAMGYILIPLLASSVLAGLGLMTPFTTVVLQKLEPGRAYNVGQAGARTFLITNRGDGRVSVVVAAQRPEKARPGYEPIPDTAWLKVSPERFEMAPGETKECKVTLALPKDPALLGRHFQAALWSRTEGGSLAAGLRSALLFSVGAEAPPAAPVPAASVPGIALNPAALSFKGVPTGREAELTSAKKEISVTNESDVPRRIQLAVLFGAEAPGHVPAPEPSFLRAEPREMLLAPGETGKVRLFSRVPGGKAHRGRGYAFQIRARFEEGNGEAAVPVLIRIGR